MNPVHNYSPPPPMLHPADNPPSSSSSPLPATPRPPARRSRKAINCEPCRASKLKCDRARPCSSCVLRGTAPLCYQGDTQDHPRLDQSSRIDPYHEIARVRQSLSHLESYIARTPSWLSSAFPSVDHSPRQLKHESFDPPLHQSPTNFAPAALAFARVGSSGLYAGPTSPASHLAFSFDDLDDYHDGHDSPPLEAPPNDLTSSSRDFDLLGVLPELSIADALLAHYFDYCQWEYFHLHHHTFSHAWARFKSSGHSDRLVLSTVFMVFAIALQFLPPRHHLIDSLPDSPSDLSQNYYNIACTALHRYHAERRGYSIELIELLLLRTHYLSITKDQCEDLWTFRGELVTISLAMGLHRDPARLKISREQAERHRWAWWNIMLVERWLAFMFGRPLAICNHHFDTQFPSALDPSYDPTGRLHLPHVHLFRLAEILGDIMEDAVSVRPVPYDRVITQDKALDHWLQTIPHELELDDYCLARTLASSAISVRRTGTQSVAIRILFYHIRFTLHRPYACHARQISPGDRAQDARWQQSLETAINAANKLTALVIQARPDFALTAPGSLSWSPFHAFAAAMFFAFQLADQPDQPGATLFRANIKRVFTVLDHLRGLLMADKALAVLQALAPLYDDAAAPADGGSAREKARILSFARRMPFPCYDAPCCAGPSTGGSPSHALPLAGSPANSISPPSAASAATPAVPAATLPPQQQQQQQHTQHPQHPQHPQQQHQSHAQQHQPQHTQGPPAHYAQQRHVYEGAYPPAEEQVWGSSIGVDSGDWASFLSVIHPRPDGVPSLRGTQLS